MKNYITIAALLVAGSAFANAAEVTLHETTFTSPSAQALHNAFSTNADATAANILLNDKAYYTNGNKGYAYAGLYVTTGGGLKFNHSTNVTVSHLYIESGVKMKNSTDAKIGEINWSDKDRSLVISNAEGAWVDINANYGSNINLANMVATSAVYLNTLGQLTTATNSGSIYATALTDTTAIAENSSLYALSEADNTVTRTLLVGDYSNWNGTVTLKGVSTYNVIKDSTGLKVAYAIPEPSAFGLLAGLGALALVSARRRRR